MEGGTTQWDSVFPQRWQEHGHISSALQLGPEPCVRLRTLCHQYSIWLWASLGRPDPDWGGQVGDSCTETWVGFFTAHDMIEVSSELGSSVPVFNFEHHFLQ